MLAHVPECLPMSPTPALAVPRPVIDAEHLRRQTMDDGALAAELLTLLHGQIERLAPVALTGGPSEAADAAHTLKGAGRAVGAFPLADAACDLEAALRAGRVDRAAARRLSEEARRALAELRPAG
jgi:HPt (histidine-containing phosphotransfer) domain-containing protein